MNIAGKRRNSCAGAALMRDDSFRYQSCLRISDVEPVDIMENILFAVDELTGLCMLPRMRPSKNTQDMELKSLKKIKTSALRPLPRDVGMPGADPRLVTG